MRRIVGRWAMLVAVVLGAGNCKLDEFVISGNSDPDGPVAGILLVVLATPNPDDGAVRITLTGPQVTTPQAASSSYVVFSSQRAPQELDIVVLGDLQAEALVAMPILDVATVDAYQASVTVVATRSDSLRADLSGYSALIQVVPDQGSGN